MDLVSIIMPSFNSEKYVGSAIDSVLVQTYDNWELLICDDGSVDNSRLVINSYVELDSRIRLISNYYPKGAPGARNSALEDAQGRYIAFLDSDDIWYSDKLEQQISFMKAGKIAFSYSYNDVMDENGCLLGTYMAPSEVNAKKMKMSNFISCITAVYDCKVLGKISQPQIKKRNDFALWLKILNGKVVETAYCLPKVTARYRVNSYGLSSDKLDSFIYFQRCLINYGACSRFSAYYYSCIYLVIILIKKKANKFYNWFVRRL